MKTCHVVSIPDNPSNGDKKRYSLATSTWRHLYDVGIQPVHIFDHELKRNSKTELGDTRTIPFARDLIQIAEERYDPDLFILTNCDTCISSEVIPKISDMLGQRECCIAKRFNFDKLEGEIPHDKITTGVESPYGYDFFVFSKSWKKQHWKHFPDVLIAYEKWDILLSDLIHITVPLCEVKGIIYHEEHGPYFWSSSNNKFTNPGNRYNIEVSKKVYSKFRILRFVAGLQRGEFDSNRDVAIGSIQYELKSIYQQEKNLLTYFCDPI